MLEIACFNSSAIEAAKAGADRIELCADYASGGVTPSQSLLSSIRKELKELKINVPINVMIRPRAGDFVYNDEEFRQMKNDIQSFKESGEASGFVFGILDEENKIDMERNRELVEMAAPLPCTFHRAFDQVADRQGAAEQIIECGFRSILTSGGEKDAVSGVEIVAELQKKCGDRISFILGGGIRSTNVEALKQWTDIKWFHSAAITQAGDQVDGKEVNQLQRILKGK
jgi:copper homeostasis protein